MFIRFPTLIGVDVQLVSDGCQLRSLFADLTMDDIVNKLVHFGPLRVKEVLKDRLLDL